LQPATFLQKKVEPELKKDISVPLKLKKNENPEKTSEEKEDVTFIPPKLKTV
jgi:hypothetical protein